MYLVLKLLAGLYDSRDGDWADDGASRSSV